MTRWAALLFVGCCPATASGVWTVTGDCTVVPEEPECVTSGNYPLNYGFNERCTLYIDDETQRRLEVESFHTKRDHGILHIDEDSFSGESPAGLDGRVVDKTTYIRWRSDGSTSRYRGWKICARPSNLLNGLILPALVIGTALVALTTGCFYCFCWKANSPKAAPTKDPTTVPSNGRQIRCRTCSRTTTQNTKSNLSYTCPFCLAVNEFSIVQGPAGTPPAKAPLPHYWTSNRVDGKSGGLLQETATVQLAMQILMDRTWKDAVTRDRPSGGGLCKFEVLMVHRNENMHQWDRYVRTRSRIGQGCQGCRQQAAKTLTQVTDSPEALEFHLRSRLDPACNEFYLFHGTNPTAARAICDNSFRMNMAGSNAGSLYGAGLYFAEASSKADEYASEEPNGIFAGQYAMLVCRVACGNMLYTDEERPNTNELVQPIVTSRVKHSILGDRETCRGTYREFVVFDRDQVYPEYAIIYRRVPVRREESH